MATKVVMFKIIDKDGNVLRVLPVSVKAGKDLEKRALEIAVKDLKEGEEARLAPMPPATPPKETAKAAFRFTFRFKIKSKKESKIVKHSAAADTQADALKAAVAKVKEQLKEGESFRYLNECTKEKVG